MELAPDFSHLKVLIADDMSFWRTLMRDFVDALGVRQVRAVSSAREAWKVVCGFQPHILICDWQMLDGEGIELLRMVRRSKESPNRFMNVMMVTAFNEEHRVRQALREGVNCYLTKPMTAQDFLRKFTHCALDRRPFEASPSYLGPQRNEPLATDDIVFV
jgi:CheY-like chemotaxis protein